MDLVAPKGRVSLFWSHSKVKVLEYIFICLPLVYVSDGSFVDRKQIHPPDADSNFVSRQKKI